MSKDCRLRTHFRSIAGIATVLLVSLGANSNAAEPKPGQEQAKASLAKRALGEELFAREWIAADPRAHGGDGLGPVFNDSSCIACHNQGGTGGGGPAGKNVDIVTAFSADMEEAHVESVSVLGLMFGSLFGGLRSSPKIPKADADGKDEAAQKKQLLVKKQREALGKVHPGFLTARSVVLHRFGTDVPYSKWRAEMIGLQNFGFAVDPFNGGSQDPFAKDAKRISLPRDKRATLNRLLTETQLTPAHNSFMGPAQVNEFFIVRSERNPTSLFGAGKLDAVPDKVLLAAADKKHEAYPEVTGRVARLKNGKIGRFGWKNQIASLEDFVLTACAVELGLDVPGHSQGGLPHQPSYKAPGLDLNREECNALISYVQSLAPPRETVPRNEQLVRRVHDGKNLFTAVGCAACHVENLGDAKGAYSDLLLHDMGPRLGDTGSYGTFVPNSPEQQELDEPLPSLVSSDVQVEKVLTLEEEKNLIGAMRHEWRTPPLWGVRDSAPYLHDGRAKTLEQAIALHGGEASVSARQFFALEQVEQQQVLSFLKSLVAPQ